jgi:hypothetical protein
MSLKNIEGRTIVKCDPAQKNQHKFADGTVLKLERNTDNFDRKYTQQVLGECISSDVIPTGAIVLFHHNSNDIQNEIKSIGNLSGEEIASGIKYLSLSNEAVFFWKMTTDNEWNVLDGYCTALRVFKPYKGVLDGITPTKIENVLYITSGELKGKVCHTVKAADYSITFVNENGKDETIIRARHFPEYNSRQEIIAIAHDFTSDVLNEKLLIGLSENNCKTLNEWQRQ